MQQTQWRAKWTGGEGVLQLVSAPSLKQQRDTNDRCCSNRALTLLQLSGVNA